MEIGPARLQPFGRMRLEIAQRHLPRRHLICEAFERDALIVIQITTDLGGARLAEIEMDVGSKAPGLTDGERMTVLPVSRLLRRICFTQ